MFSVGIKVNIASTDIIFRYRPEELEVIYKKDTFKNFAKITEKHLYRGLFFNKVSGRARPTTLLQRGSSIGVFL